jgi:hypothetical protein
MMDEQGRAETVRGELEAADASEEEFEAGLGDAGRGTDDDGFAGQGVGI